MMAEGGPPEDETESTPVPVAQHAGAEPGPPGATDGTPAVKDPMMGRLLGGQYRIEGHLGTGGFGEVYRAIQEKTGQLVALKLIKPRYGKGAPTMERQLARFRREMRVCAELHHPHVVRLIDTGENEDGLLFSVFEFVPGPTLAELLRERGALTVRATIELMGQVLDALVCAHGKGVIHRDLKPNNVMVSTTGARPQATVLDFGISAFLEGMMVDEFHNLTVTREILGTPAYAAPEQLRGEQPTVKSDLYAWGLVFVECVLGRRVFDGPSSMEIAHRQLSAEPVWLPARLQKHWLGTLLRWTLEKDPARRAGDTALLMEKLLEKRSLGDLVDGNGYFVENETDEMSTTGRAILADATGSHTGSALPGERRQLTAVCCSIGVRATGQAHSPEALDQALRDAQSLCVSVARRFGGHEAATLGGQVLVYFGFPLANDTDARRAAIVALEIVHEIRRRGETQELPVEVRVGVHTGIVTASLDRALSPIFGVTPQQAAMLAQHAPANSILVSADSFPYLARSFELESITAPGSPAVYRLVAESRAESAAPAANRAPFVGRARELALLEAAWNRAREGHGETVLVRGEAGIGKSRLARELRRSLEKARSRWLETRCLPETENSALAPLVDLLRHELNLTAAAADGGRHLEASLVELGVDPAAAMPLLCPWLGLPLPEPHCPLTFSPQRQKTLLLERLADLLVTMAERHSAPILIEDLHWADPTTLECLELLVRKAAGRRCLLLLTARPDAAFQPARELGQVIRLESLGSAEVEQIVEGLAESDGFSRMLVSDVVQRADGIPLFVEEIVRFLENSSAQPTATGPLPELQRRNVPASLRDLLTGRLDQLGRAKETAQVAAAIGREFDHRLLSRVFDGDEASLLADLEKMVSADVLLRRRHIDNPVYLFRHALIRDAAYESLVPEHQRELHQRIPRALVEHFPEVAEAQPELMAGHYERAGLVRESIAEWLRAGQRGLDRAANRETIVHLRRALALLPKIPEEAERMKLELQLQLALAPALMAIQGWASPETGAACMRARDLCHALDDMQRLFPALWGLWTFQFVGGNLEPALVTARQTLTMARMSGSRKIELAARHAVGFSHLYRGEFSEARDHGAAGLALFDLELERDNLRTFQVSSTCACAYIRAASLWMLGYRDDAEEGLALMYRRVRELEHAPSLASAMGFALFFHHYQQDVERTRRTADELFALSTEHDFQHWLAVSLLYRAWARARQGEVEQGISELRGGIQQFKASGAQLTLVGVHAMLGEALLLAGEREQALAALDAGLRDAMARGEHVCEPELHRLRGEALKEQDPRAAEAAFREALRLATSQQARSLSLRAALGLTRLLMSHGRVAEARGLLAAEHGWFTQGFGTPDLMEARALLDALSPGRAGFGGG
jgi:TOMM system kinase/cyclase fusion protein